jgi:protein-disulfide isomerase
MIVRRSFLVFLLVCLGCSAQSPPSSSSAASAPSSDITRVIERQVRAHYSLAPDIKVLIGALRSSDFPNYDAVTITFASPGKKQDFEFLLSRDHKSLLRLTRLDLTTDPYVDIMKKIDVTGRPTRGNKDAKVTVVNFDDFECPFCSRMHSTLFPGIVKEYGDRVLFIYKDYPLEEIHPWAVHAAVDANCLAAQNGDAYWDYADYLHHNGEGVTAEYREKGRAASAAMDKVSRKEEADKVYKEKGLEAAGAELDKLATLQAQKHNLDVPKLQACVKAQDETGVRASMREGEGVGVDATPAMFVNGQKLDGAVPADEIRTAIDQALKDAGVAPPEHKAAAGEPKTPSVAPSK